MADEQKLSEQEFNAVAARVSDSLPKDASDADYNARMMEAVQKYERLPGQMRQMLLTGNIGSTPTPHSGRELMQNVKDHAPELAASAVGAAFIPPGTTTALSRAFGPAVAASRWTPAIASGLGASGGALARGDQPADAAAEGAKTAVMGRYLPQIVEGVMNLPGRAVDMGRTVARGYLKPALEAGRQEAMHVFDRPMTAGQANNKVVEAALKRNILGANSPDQAIQEQLADTGRKLDKVVGDQPTRLNNMLGDVFRRGHEAATRQATNIPAAQEAIDAEVNATLTGSLGGKLDYGTPRPPPRGDTLSAQVLLNQMKGAEPTAGTPPIQRPNLANPALQRIESQAGGGNITTGRPIVTQEVKGPALATSRVEAPYSGATPRRFAGGASTQVMREVQPGSETAGLLGRNVTPEVKAPEPQLIASHRPQPITAKEALDWSRKMSGDNNWDKAPTGLVNWFRRAQESAGRTAVKDAVPEARDLMGELGDLLSLKRVVPQAMNREMNKNTVAKLPSMLAALMAKSPLQAAAVLGGMNMAEQNTGKIAQTLYNTGNKYMPEASTIKNTGMAALQAALTELLKKRESSSTPQGQ